MKAKSTIIANIYICRINPVIFKYKINKFQLFIIFSRSERAWML